MTVVFNALSELMPLFNCNFKGINVLKVPEQNGRTA